VIEFLRSGKILNLVGFGRKRGLVRLLHGVPISQAKSVTLARGAVKATKLDGFAQSLPNCDARITSAYPQSQTSVAAARTSKCAKKQA
jgi:hypothetical protein